MVLIFRTRIANIMTFLIKNLLFPKQDEKKSPLCDYGVTKVSVCIRPRVRQWLKESGICVTGREDVYHCHREI